MHSSEQPDPSTTWEQEVNALQFSMKLRLFLLMVTVGLALTLSGCVTTAPRVVNVPVAIPCDVDMPGEPAWATGSLSSEAGIFDQAKALLAEREQARGYQDELRSALKVCAEREEDDFEFDDEDESAD